MSASRSWRFAPVTLASLSAVAVVAACSSFGEDNAAPFADASIDTAAQLDGATLDARRDAVAAEDAADAADAGFCGNRKAAAFCTEFSGTNPAEGFTTADVVGPAQAQSVSTPVQSPPRAAHMTTATLPSGQLARYALRRRELRRGSGAGAGYVRLHLRHRA